MAVVDVVIIVVVMGGDGSCDGGSWMVTMIVSGFSIYNWL